MPDQPLPGAANEGQIVNIRISPSTEQRNTRNISREGFLERGEICAPIPFPGLAVEAKSLSSAQPLPGLAAHTLRFPPLEVLIIQADSIPVKFEHGSPEHCLCRTSPSPGRRFTTDLHPQQQIEKRLYVIHFIKLCADPAVVFS